MPFAIKQLNKGKFILYFLNAFIVNIAIYAPSIVLSIYINERLNLERFQMFILIIFLLKVFEIITTLIWNIGASLFATQYGNDLKIKYLDRVYHLDAKKSNDVHHGYIKSQIDTITSESSNLFHTLMSIVNGFLIAIGSFLVSVFLQDKLIFIFCLILIIIIVLLNTYFGKKNVPLQEEFIEENSKYNSTYVDFMQNIKSLKRFQAIGFGKKKINESFDRVFKTKKKYYKFFYTRYSSVEFLIFLMYIAILINLYFQMKNGVAIISYVIFYATIFRGLLTELNDVSRLFTSISSFVAADKKIEELIGDAKEKATFKTFENITLKNIEFKYTEEQKQPIEIPNFILNKKDKISIVGESGQGKTTFLQLLLKHYESEIGEYLVDGNTIDKVPDIAYISQDADLFDLTIRENLTLGRKVKDDVLMQYLNDAGLSDWLNELDMGMNTKVGDRGVKLSAGQKQRLNIIRGIILDKELYILDEPTSNLDELSEQKIIDMINKYLKDKTYVIVTHRKNLKALCNKHFEFKKHTMKEVE